MFSIFHLHLVIPSIAENSICGFLELDLYLLHFDLRYFQWTGVLGALGILGVSNRSIRSHLIRSYFNLGLLLISPKSH